MKAGIPYSPYSHLCTAPPEYSILAANWLSQVATECT